MEQINKNVEPRIEDVSDSNEQELNNILLNRSNNYDNNTETNNEIENDSSELSNNKKFLLIGSGLSVLFILIIGVVWLLNQEEGKKDNSLLPPEPILVGNETKDENSLFKDIEVKDKPREEIDEFEKIVKDIKARNNVYTPDLVDEDIEKYQAPKKEEIKKEVKPKIQKSKEVLTGRYYVQIGAFSKQVDPKFLSNIGIQGFTYKLVKKNVAGKDVTKVLIGPYKSIKDANQNMEDVKTKLKTNAFVLRI